MIIKLIIMKTKMKMKDRSHRYDINSRRSKHEHKHIKMFQYDDAYIICLYVLSNT